MVAVARVLECCCCLAYDIAFLCAFLLFSVCPCFGFCCVCFCWLVSCETLNLFLMICLLGLYSLLRLFVVVVVVAWCVHARLSVCCGVCACLLLRVCRCCCSVCLIHVLCLLCSFCCA